MSSTKYMVISVIVMVILNLGISQLTKEPTLHWMSGWFMCLVWVNLREKLVTKE